MMIRDDDRTYPAHPVAPGRLLTASTLGQSLWAAGRKMLVVSSGSTGSAFLNNHTLSGGAILHYQYALPEQLREAMKVVGPPPVENAPAGALDRYAADAFLKVGIPRVDPSVTVMWLSDLDSTAHAKGIGDPATIQILRRPIVLLLDDLHWADKPTLLMLWHLVGAQPRGALHHRHLS